MAIAVLTSNETGANSLIDINANFVDLDTTKADLASPTFTGTPTLPTGTIATTQSQVDNSTKVATTAYVDTAVAAFAISDDLVKSITVSLSAANLLAMYVTPVECIPAPGAGKVIYIQNALLSFTAGGSAYLNGGDLRLQYAGYTDNVFETVFVAEVIRGSVGPLAAQRGKTNLTAANGLVANTAVNITNANAAFDTGNGTAKLFISYRILTL